MAAAVEGPAQEARVLTPVHPPVGIHPDIYQIAFRDAVQIVQHFLAISRPRYHYREGFGAIALAMVNEDAEGHRFLLYAYQGQAQVKIGKSIKHDHSIFRPEVFGDSPFATLSNNTIPSMGVICLPDDAPSITITLTTPLGGTTLTASSVAIPSLVILPYGEGPDGAEIADFVGRAMERLFPALAEHLAKGSMMNKAAAECIAGCLFPESIIIQHACVHILMKKAEAVDSLEFLNTLEDAIQLWSKSIALIPNATILQRVRNQFEKEQALFLQNLQTAREKFLSTRPVLADKTLENNLLHATRELLQLQTRLILRPQPRRVACPGTCSPVSLPAHDDREREAGEKTYDAEKEKGYDADNEKGASPLPFAHAHLREGPRFSPIHAFDPKVSFTKGSEMQ